MRASTSFPGPVPIWSSGLPTLSGLGRWLANLGTVADPRTESASETSSAADRRLDDAAWVARVLEGDEDAARALVHRLYPTIIKSVRCHLPKRTSEEDLAQAVFAKIFKKLHQFSGLVPLEHWVARITINTCLDQLRREAALPELRMADLREEEQFVMQHLVFIDDDLPGERNSAARELLEKLLARLKPDERMVITLLHLEERTVEEISRVTGWSVSLVKVKAFRARQKMRGLWQTLFKREKL